MLVSLVGYNHVHNADFIGDYPDASNGFLGLVIRSRFVFRQGGEEKAYPKNTLIIYRQGTPRYYRADGEDFINDWFVFKLEREDEALFEALQIPLDLPVVLDNVHPFSMLIQSIAYESYTDSLYAHDVINCYLRIFFFKLSDAFLNQTRQKAVSLHDKMNMVHTKIHKLSYIKYTIESLAAEATISPHYFQHLYKELFGVSPIKDIVAARIDHAKSYLVQSDMSIKRISEFCGYDNDVHFMRQFKKAVGVTPTAYRKKHMK